LLKDGSLPDAQREQYVEHLAASADLLSGLLDDVLDMSKIEAGEMTLEHIPYAVHEVLQQAFAAFCWRGEEKGLHMDAAFDPAVPARVHGDPVRVRQIVLNYLSNTVKFTVDDNAVNRLVAAAMLERSGARVVEAHDGFEAIELVRRRGATLDLVLMDLYMPGCDGFEAARAIHRLVDPAGLPIVALSASVLNSEREAARAAGMTAFLSKPLIEGELVRVASRVLAARPTTV
jgi:CheY-like chemotaxis protein